MNSPIDMELPPLESLIQDDEKAGSFFVDKRNFTDPQIFDLEMEKIFESTWVFLCHESLIPENNDYYSTKIGRRPILVTRDDAGGINAFINACSHRGAQLCRTERGNEKFLTCPYHGWVFNSAGECVDVRDQQKGNYTKRFKDDGHSLKSLAKVESYRGFVFGSLSDDVPTLVDHLAEARHFIDLVVDQTDEGQEVIPGGSKYVHVGNWKMQPENGIDGYHALATHGNYFKLIATAPQRHAKEGAEDLKRPFDDRILIGESGWYDLKNGHAVMWITFPMPENRPIFSRYEELKEKFGEGRAKWMVERQRNVVIYPNLLLMEHISTQIRVVQPRSADETAVQIYCLGTKGESQQERTLRIRQYEDFYNASGLATPDDLVNFDACHAGFVGGDGELVDGYARGMENLVPQPDYAAKELGINPAAGGADAEDETLMVGQHRQWLKLMTR
ncbi:MAG: aromatic ring-hydroxylating dioxygenase subunit alpha [Immundisolibacteraceae bacterium]|nr:aromatic ring-hydroxylating dioxygenase subunit alpha [Immundisolibacteraceae bacterium]